MTVSRVSLTVSRVSRARSQDLGPTVSVCVRTYMYAHWETVGPACVHLGLTRDDRFPFLMVAAHVETTSADRFLIGAACLEQTTPTAHTRRLRADECRADLARRVRTLSDHMRPLPREPGAVAASFARSRAAQLARRRRQCRDGIRPPCRVACTLPGPRLRTVATGSPAVRRHEPNQHPTHDERNPR